MSMTYFRTEDAVVTLSDDALRRLAAENTQRVASSYIYEITAGAGLSGVVVAIVWALVKAHTGA
jgi:hypothetical protein